MTKQAIRSSRKYQENERTKSYVFNGCQRKAYEIKNQKAQKKTLMDSFKSMLKNAKAFLKKGEK